MAKIDQLERETRSLFRPPPRRNLSEWANEFFYLSEESSATSGRWVTLPYQRGVMDAITNPDVREVYWIKCARIGATKIMNATVGYYAHQDPCPVMMVQPTVEDAKGYSREEITPMFRDCKALAPLLPDAGAKDGRNALLHKIFAGGSISMVGANSGRGFRRTSRKVILLDEIDEYPISAGTQGDPIKLAMNRSAWYWDRKTFGASTPGNAGESRIEAAYKTGDQRRYFVPCPHCGAKDYLKFKPTAAGGGHVMRWPKGKPREAYFECSRGGCRIEHKDKFRIIAAGEWRAERPFNGIASFRIWAAYSHSPNATWGDIASEFVSAEEGGPETLKVFINTVLGETWQDQGEAPDWQRLYLRRENYVIGTVPKGVVFLTAGVDVQRDRLVYEVVGWGVNRQSWSVDAGVLPGDTSGPEVWKKLDELLAHAWLDEDGGEFGIKMMAIDSGYNTQVVYNWTRQHSSAQVIACKGSATAAVLISSPSKVDVTVRGKKKKRGQQVWSLGVNVGKGELYGNLRQELPVGDLAKDAKGEPIIPEPPPGYCHFPEYGEDFFQQLTAEHLVRVTKRTGFTALEWQLIPGRENHFLDTRILARAAASISGLDRLTTKARGQIRGKAPPPQVKRLPPPAATSNAARFEAAFGVQATPATGEEKPVKVAKYSAPEKKQSWLGGRRGSGRRDSWLGKRR